MGYKIKKIILFIIAISFVLYQTASFHRFNYAIDIAKSVNSLAVSIFIFFNLKNGKERNNLIYFLIGAFVFLVFVTDIGYVTLRFKCFPYVFVKSAVDTIYLIIPFVIVTVCFLIIKSEWSYVDKKQSFMNFIVLFICSYCMLRGMISIMFPRILLSLGDLNIIFTSVTLSILLLALIMLLSSNSQKIAFSNFMTAVVVSFIIFSIVDSVYAYQVSTISYSSTVLLDSLYAIPVNIIVIAICMYKRDINRNISSDYKDEIEKYTPNKSSGYIVTLILFVIMIADVILYNLKAISSSQILIAFLAMILYLLITLYYTSLKENKVLLESQLQINYELEKRVYERTKELEEKNREFLKIINTDSLTMLGSRKYLMDILDSYDEYKTENVIIFIIDILHFKVINNTSGHKTGDMVLKEVSRRLKNIFKGEKVFRTDSNEFAVLIQDNKSTAQLVDIAQNITLELTDVIYIDTDFINIDIAIGCCKYDSNMEEYSELLKNAEYASKEAKADYKTFNNYRFYDQEMADKINRRITIESLLRTINYDDEFTMFFQPQFSIDGSELIGMESLLRWNSPVLGNVSPGEFIPIAEESNSILKVVQWTIKRSSEQIKEWNLKYNKNYRIAINISPKYLKNYDFLSEVKYFVDEKQVNPVWLDFEMTEMSVMQAGESICDLFDKLHHMGINISIDDFGTGYSSLSYIKNFNVDKIKISKELVDNIVTDKNEYMIVNAIIMMSKGLKLETIAEGVEKKEQRDILLELGCNQIQGYYYGRPVNAQEFEKTYLINRI
ncbi:MAG: putative bifunctional diguanylate cyclase/phosphodiesterase [Peptoanaerobacter stomatis]|uniref:putative bifunctional diguanylate cyclase/phosphodiesterase n=1 Tax=Peptoanaerobacter stomatis TaxID=796937 RepID=UPI003FA057AE